MSIGSMGGVLGSAAGAPLSQTQGSETERARSEGARQARERDTAQQAERSAGVGQTQEDQGASERDADGRRQWEAPKGEEQPADTVELAGETIDATQQAKDSAGDRGSQLDLQG